MNRHDIHVATWGTAGSRVVLVHGSAQGSRVSGTSHFSAQERLAARGWRLIVPDRPGHGRSPDPHRPDDAEADGAWVADLLEDGAHLVGHSFGGCVALAAAVRRPAAVRSLTLIEPAMQKVAIASPHVRKLILRVIWIMLFSTSAAKRAKAFAKLVGIPEHIRGGSSHEELTQMGHAIKRLKLPSKKALEQQLVQIKEQGTPLLMVTGGWNPAIEAVGDTVARLGNGQRLVIPSPHHFPQSISEAFNDALDAFMRQHDHARPALRQ